MSKTFFRRILPLWVRLHPIWIRHSNMTWICIFWVQNPRSGPFYLRRCIWFLNDHVFWRRNYWPKDPPAIGYSKANGPDASHFREIFFTELFSLVSDLKLDVPVFSPRYMAHMISETTLPSLVAYFATLLYNPNNVSSEASPVTIRHELEVGKQFARLFGFDDRTSFGHLTSGGTIANYESLWFHKAGRFSSLGH